MQTASQAESVAKAVVKSRFKRSESIVEQGKKSSSLAIILTGRARVVTTNSRGCDVIVVTPQPGDYIGEMSLIDNEPHSATARAERQPDMLMLGRLEFARCLSKNSPIAYAVTNGLMQRLRHAGRIKEPPALMDVDG